MIGFLVHPSIDTRATAVDEARAFLERSGIEVWQATRDGRPRVLRRTRLLVTFGGDGTLLAGARLAAPLDVPLLGVNLGRLGFLTELEIEGLCEGLRRFLEGDHRIEPRTLLDVTVDRGGRQAFHALGLNEVAVQRSIDDGLIRLTLMVDSQEVGQLDADGAIVATATGSTAYALAAGGPILEPTIEDLLLVPLNPFALTVRPIVFPPRQKLVIELSRSVGAAVVDGGTVWHLKAGDRVGVCGYERPLRMVRFSPPDRFYALLRQKLGWGLPLVPTPRSR